MRKYNKNFYDKIITNQQKRDICLNILCLTSVLTIYFYFPYSLTLQFSILIGFFILLDSIVLAYCFKKKVFYEDMIILKKGNKYKNIYSGRKLFFKERNLIKYSYSVTNINFFNFFLDYSVKTFLFFICLVFLDNSLDMDINKDISSLLNFYVGLSLFSFIIIGRFLLFTVSLKTIKQSGKNIKKIRTSKIKNTGCYHTYYNQYHHACNIYFTILEDDINGIFLNDYIIFNNNVYVSGNMTTLVMKDIVEYMKDNNLSLHHIKKSDIELMEITKCV